MPSRLAQAGAQHPAGCKPPDYIGLVDQALPRDVSGKTINQAPTAGKSAFRKSAVAFPTPPPQFTFGQSIYSAAATSLSKLQTTSNPPIIG
jgi:hypothetical protein